MKRMSKLISILLGLTLALGAALPPAVAEDAVSSATVRIQAMPELKENPDSDILVVYFSTDDTVKAVAAVVADALGADIFEVIPEIPYTDADLAYYTDCRADREQSDSAARPAIAAWPGSLDRYDTVFLGYPIWHGQAPKILYTLLEGIDVSGKTILPFCTSGSSGAGSSAENLRALTGETAAWRDVKRIDNGSTAEDIRAWALSLNLERGETNMQMRIDGTPVAVAWEDNESVSALRELAASGLAIQMSMYGGFEQVGSIGRRLPSADQQTTTAPGDIVLYSGDQLVVFYGSNSWAYTRLGRITDKDPGEMRELLGNGDVTITLALDGPAKGEK